MGQASNAYKVDWKRKRKADIAAGLVEPRRCTMPDCDGVHEALGMCNKHYLASKADPEQIRRNNLWANYRMTVEQYDAMLAAQDGRCAICGTDDPGARRFHVDHDHVCCSGAKSCGECTRGLLCATCNHGLGHFHDDPVALAAAIAYLGGF